MAAGAYLLRRAIGDLFLGPYRRAAALTWDLMAAQRSGHTEAAQPGRRHTLRRSATAGNGKADRRAKRQASQLSRVA
jgi:hypothetical protein